MATKNRPKYVAEYERDENGYWTAIVKIGPKEAAISDGPTLQKARQRIRQALSLHIAKPEGEFDVEDRERLPAKVTRLLEAYRIERRDAEQHAARLADAQAAAARALVDLGLSLRDAGGLLGISGQQVEQVTRAAAAAPAIRPRRSAERRPRA